MLWRNENIAEITVWAEDTELKQNADSLAEQLELPVQATSSGLQLLYSNNTLQLIDYRPKAAGAVYVDFVGGKAAHRRQHGGGRGQTIAKAIGLKSGLNPSVLDCTAGMGRDAFVLASLGCAVTMLERAPITHALLEDALRRAKQDENTHAITQNMQLAGTSSFDYLQQGKNDCDVIYMDPMYPHREKSALVKKEMRIFRELVGDDLDADKLLEAALDSKPARVVVKRPKGAPHLNDRKPSVTAESKNTRYDIYPFRKLEK